MTTGGGGEEIGLFDGQVSGWPGGDGPSAGGGITGDNGRGGADGMGGCTTGDEIIEGGCWLF